MSDTLQPPIPVVVAGCGAITKFFYASALGWLETQGLVRVAALCDPNEPSRAGIHARFPHALSLARFEEAPLAPGTVVVVATPPKLHATQTLHALEQGCGVLCEKPMAASLADAEAMVAAAARTNRPLAIGLYRRFFRAARVIKNLCLSQALGPVLSYEVEEGGPFRWDAASDSFFRREVTPGGVLYDTGVHTLDLLLWWFGEPATIDYRDDAAGGLEANSLLRMTHAAGFGGTVRLSRDWATRNLFRINFAMGSVAFSPGQAGRISLRLNGNDTMLDSEILTMADDRLPVPTVRDPEGSPQAFIHQLINIVQAVRDGTPLHIPAPEGLRSLRLIEACYRARRPLEQPWLTPAETDGYVRLQKGASV
ncbi:MAG: Gfo/Idh/MocA family oxidoreductase [Opitutaceae bacterium]|nr:Gfo/Idh/MocA family oxidoreductase [Opitutaceae bacterium]